MIANANRKIENGMRIQYAVFTCKISSHERIRFELYPKNNFRQKLDLLAYALQIQGLSCV
jgi:hypothetical protein